MNVVFRLFARTPLLSISLVLLSYHNSFLQAQFCSSTILGQFIVDECTTTISSETYDTFLQKNTPVLLSQNRGLITAHDINVRTSGINSEGAVAINGGAINFTHSNIITLGSGGSGLFSAQTSAGIHSQINATYTNITTSNLGAHGVYAYNGGLINLNNVRVSTSGLNAYGIISEGYLFSGSPINTTINATDTIIETKGHHSTGAISTAIGNLNLSNTYINTMGPQAEGIYVTDSGSIATLLKTEILSAEYDAAHVVDSGALYLTDSKLRSARYAIAVTGGSPTEPNSVIINGGSLISGLDSFHVEDGIAQFRLSNETKVSPSNGNLLNVISHNPFSFTSNVTFTIENMTTKGNIISDNSSITSVYLISNSVFTGIQQNTLTNVDNSSKWIVNGNSDIHSLALAGKLLFKSPTDPTQRESYKILTTQNYKGIDGTIEFNTVLNKDDSPSDILIINGGVAEGSTSFNIHNTTGKGALTTSDGILIVDTINNGTTTNKAFYLVDPLLIGPYEYNLYRGGVDGNNPDNWYLRSSLTSYSRSDSTSIVPNYRQEVSLYAALPSTALIYGRMLIDSLQQRTGDDAFLFKKRDPKVKCKKENSFFNHFWSRVIAKDGKQDGKNFFHQGPNFKFNMYAWQAGLDIYRNVSSDGTRDYVGILEAIGHGRSEVKHFTHVKAGTNKFEAYTVGGYWTHFSPTGWYTDCLFTKTWYEGVRAQSTRLRALKTRGEDFVGSIESGYSWNLRENLTIEPQGQLIYQTVCLDKSKDRVSTVDFHQTRSFVGRIGIRFSNQWLLEDSPSSLPGPLMAWLRTDYLHDFNGKSKTFFPSEDGPIGITSNLHEDWLETTVGFTNQLTNSFYLYGSLTADIFLDRCGYSCLGSIGIKGNF